MKVEDLNTLITINLDRIEGFKKIEEQAKDASNVLFLTAGKVLESELFITQIESIFQHFGKTIERKDSIEGKLVRTWMNVLNAVSRDNVKNLIESIIFGEDSADKAYEEILISLRNDEQFVEFAPLIVQQQLKIKKSLAEFIELREVG